MNVVWRVQAAHRGAVHPELRRTIPDHSVGAAVEPGDAQPNAAEFRLQGNHGYVHRLVKVDSELGIWLVPIGGCDLRGWGLDAPNASGSPPGSHYATTADVE